MRTHDEFYTYWDKLDDLLYEDLNNYWNRKNKIAIVKFKGGNRCLTFLVEDVENPQIPGYPANAIEYFESYELAKEAVKDLYNRLMYYPKYEARGHYE